VQRRLEDFGSVLLKRYRSTPNFYSSQGLLECPLLLRTCNFYKKRLNFKFERIGWILENNRNYRVGGDGQTENDPARGTGDGRTDG
jgi:hypothetical protein